MEITEMYEKELNEDPSSLPADHSQPEADDLTLLRSPSNKSAARRQKTYGIANPKFDYKFNIIVCDECHLLKNRETSLHKAVKCLNRSKLILCSATPMVNTPADNISYLLLAWPTATANKNVAEFSYNSFYGPGSKLLNYGPTSDTMLLYFDRIKPEDGASLDDLLVDLEGNAQEIRKRIVKLPLPQGQEPNPITSPERDGDFYEPIKEALSQGRRVYKLNPANVYWAMREFGLDFDGSRKVFRDVMSMILVKRSMHTPLCLPDGTVVTPGDDIKGAKFSIHHVQFPSGGQKHLNSLYEEFKEKLYSPEAASEKRPDAPRGKDLARRPGDVTASGKINQRAWRHLLLAALDRRNDSLLTPSKSLCGLTDKLIPPQEARTTRQRNVQELTDATPVKSSYGKVVENAALGSDQTFTLATKWVDGGIGWLFETLKPGGEFTCPRDRYALAKWLLWYSPLLSRLVVQIKSWMAEPVGSDGLPNRVVVMAVMPWCQHQLCLALEICGFKTLSIRSDHSMLSRSQMVADFNDPKSDVDILITSMELSAFGLNLHKACAKGIVVQYPWSANHLVQILGRLPRIGQKRSVEWVILHVSYTLYDRMATIVWSKYVRQLAVESRIHDSVKSTLAEISAYSILYRMFHMGFHRYL
ncbi:P-loop containing nucleoside triphosphate hydrolase protein [Hypoxylon sp. FL1150]|nr:P-loop containing nucleoside triphosphate hydrolase protein [Hypoxylon sp. FL1150]